MAEIMRKYTIVLLGMLDRVSDEGNPIDLIAILSRFTMEAFAEMGFGIQMNRLEVEDEHPLQRAFDSAQRMIILRYQHPPFVWKLQKVLGIGAEAQLMEDVKVIDDTVLGIILKTLSNYQTEATSGTPTLVSIFASNKLAKMVKPTLIRPIYAI